MVKKLSLTPFLSLVLSLCLIVMTGCASNKQKSSTTNEEAEKSRQNATKAFSELEKKDDQKSESISNPMSSAPTQTTISNFAKLGKVTVQIDTFLVFNDAVSWQEARAQTLAFVREQALQKALPVDVSLVSLTTNMYVERNAQFDEQTAKSIFMLSSSAGRFQSEKILEEKPIIDTKSHSFRYNMRYQAEVVQLPKVYNSAYNIKVGLSNSLLKDGEQFKVSVTSNADGYLYIFDFLPDNSVAMVYPNKLFPNNFIKTQEPWIQQFTGVTLPGKEHCIETLYFVFSTEPISGWEDFCSNVSAQEYVLSGGEDSFILFQRWLAKSDPSKRVEKLAQLHIFK